MSSSAPACPACGLPIASAPQVPPSGGRVPYTDQEVAVLLSKKKKTSHLLHFFLSVFTLGLWVVIWILVAISNGLENDRIDRKIAKGK